MRWPFARAASTCATCGADVGRGAGWCGSCGARVGATAAGGDEVAAGPTAPPPDGAPTRRPDGRRVLGVLGVAALLVVVLVAAALRSPPAASLLGTPAGTSGLSATGPPPDGLRAAWSVPLGSEDVRARPIGTVPLVARNDRAVVDGVVVDLDRGVVTASVPPIEALGSDGTGVLVVDGELVRLDVLDGTVLGRTALPDQPAGPTWSELRVGDVTVLAAWDDGASTTILHDDGTVLARLEGQPLVGLDRAVEDPAAVAIRRDGDLDGPVTLVATAGGAVVAELPAGSPRVVDVVGDRAVVVTPIGEEVGGPGTGVVWSVRLLDATDGRTIDSTNVVSAVAPRLVGRLGDGGVVLATRSGAEIGVWLLEPATEGGVVALSQRRTNVLRGAAGVDDVFDASVSGMLRSVALDGDVLVLHDAAAEQVRAATAEGAHLWQRPAPAAAGIAAADGVVAVVPVDPGAPVRLLRTEDGSDLATLGDVSSDGGGSGGSGTQAPVALLDRDLALGSPAPVGRLELSVGSATWLDVVTGERRPAAEVLADRTRVDEEVTGSWRLVGVTGATGPGRAEPVILRDVGRDVVQLLVPGEGFRSVDLDLPDEGDVASYLSYVAGVTETRVALYTDSFEGPTAGVTHVVDRTTDETVHLAGVVGFGLTEELLLGFVPDESGRWVGLAGHDAATGEERWSRPPPGPWVQRWAAFDDRLLVHASPVHVEAISLVDGGTAWRYEAPTPLGTSVVLGPSHVLLATTTGAVVALDRATGVEVWRTELDRRATALVGAGEHVLLGTAGGLVVHLDGAGQEVQRLAVGNGPVRSVAALGDTVVAVVDGRAVGLRVDGSGVAPGDEVELP